MKYPRSFLEEVVSHHFQTLRPTHGYFARRDETQEKNRRGSPQCHRQISKLDGPLLEPMFFPSFNETNTLTKIRQIERIIMNLKRWCTGTRKKQSTLSFSSSRLSHTQPRPRRLSISLISEKIVSPTLILYEAPPWVNQYFRHRWNRWTYVP